MSRVPLVVSTFLAEKETLASLSDFISRADMLSMGEICFEFEEAFARYQGRRFAVLFNSGASANLALIQALKTGETWQTEIK